MTEQEINKEHSQLAPYIGQKVYQALLPFLEIWDGCQRMLFLNREMYQLKNKPKLEEKKEEKPTSPEAA